MQSAIPPLSDSALALATLEVGAEGELEVHDADVDSLLYVASGAGSLSLDGLTAELGPATAALVLAGEQAVIAADSTLELVHVTVAAVTDRHALLGDRETVVRVDAGRAQQAFGMRGYQILFGPHNGSTRATIFVGYLPPGRSPWHYHLYDEIVWIPAGPGRLHRHRSAEPEELGSGSAFRLRPREVHIVENASEEEEMTLIGTFTPAGSPSAAYLAEVDES
jgi:quercetin dioxygenase-like cupin family protein